MNRKHPLPMIFTMTALPRPTPHLSIWA